MEPTPLQFMDGVSFQLYLPAITTNYRADSIRWSEIIRFIAVEYKKCNATALDFTTQIQRFRATGQLPMQKFYTASDLVAQLKIVFWRHPGANQYKPAKIFVSTYRRPEPFNPE